MRWIRVLVVSVLVGLLLAVEVAVALPSYLLEVAFGIDPRVEPAGGDWVDISDYLMEGNGTRGKSGELDRFQAGSLDVLLDNGDRRFEPEYTGSPYYPDIELDQHVRLRATQNAVTYDVFRGFVTDWDPEWRLPSTARLTAMDAFRYFASRELTSPYAEAVLADSPTAYYRLGERKRPVATDASSNNHHGTYYGDVQRVDSLIRDDKDGAAVFDGTSAYVSLPPEVAFRGTEASTFQVWVQPNYREQTEVAGDDYALVQLKNDGGGSILAWALRVRATTEDEFTILFEYIPVGGGVSTVTFPNNPFDGDPQQIVVSRDAGSATLRFHLNGAPLGTYTDPSGAPNFTLWGEPFSILIGRDGLDGVDSSANWFAGTIDEVSLYRNARLSDARIAAHYNAGFSPWVDDTSGVRIERVLDNIDWPAGLRDIDTGGSILQSADDVQGESALNHLQRVEASEFGGLYMTGAGEVLFRSRAAIVEEARFTDSQVTIGRGVGELPYINIKPDRGDEELRTEIRLARTGGPEQAATAVGSRFFQRTFSRTDLMNQSDSEVQSLVELLLYKYETPFTAYTVTLNPRADDALWAQVFGRELEDLVTIKRIPPDGGGNGFQADAHQGDETSFRERVYLENRLVAFSR